MFIINVLDTHTDKLIRYDLAGEFATQERVEGAITLLRRLGEIRPMQWQEIRRGRKPGSKNKPKDPAVMVAKKLDEIKQILQTTPPPAHGSGTYALDLSVLKQKVEELKTGT
jgi:hypothetical protein